MFEKLFVRRAFELLAIFHLISFVESISYSGEKKIGEEKIGKIFETMKIESRTNLTRYRLIESVIRQHLINYDEDASPVHLLLHPKANPRVIESIAKICSERKATQLWTDKKTPKDRRCNRAETCFRVTQIIGIYADIDDINPRELKNSYGKSWTSRSKIVILITAMTSDHDEDSIDRVKLEQTLENFWSLDCLNVVLITMPKCEKNSTLVSDPRIFSYDPFALQPGKFNRRGKLIEFSSRIKLFPDKLRDLRGFKITVSMYHQEPLAVLINYKELGSGVQVQSLRYVSAWLNFTVDLKSAPVEASSYKISLPDGRQVGPIGDVIKNRSDFLANTVFLRAVTGMRLEFVRPFARAYIAIIVPRAGPMPGIIRVFRSIEANLAIAILVAWILLACYFLARKKKHPFFNSYRLFICQQLEGISDKISDRIFSIAWIIWAFVVCTAIQSHLIKDLTDPPFYKSIDSLEELASSSLTLMADPIYLDNLNNSLSETKKQLAEKAIRESDFAKCTGQLVDRKDVACALDGFFVKDVTRKLNQKYDKNKWRRGISHTIKEYLSDDWKTLIFKEGFPYLDKFNAGYDRMRETGLVQKWIANDTREHFEERATMDVHFKLNMLHFEGTFKILLIGEGIALAVFIVEMIFYHVSRRFGLSCDWLCT